MKRFTERDKYDDVNIIGINSVKLYEELDYDEDLILTRALYKLAKLEDFEEELGIDLVTLLRALRNGIYYKKDNIIFYTRNLINVSKYLIETKPVLAVKEATFKTCFYGDSAGEIKNATDAHYYDWLTSNTWEFKDYGKTWALTKEELLEAE